MPWTPSARKAAAAAVRARRDGYVLLMRALLDADPSLTTDQLAARLGWDRSTIRRWRARIRLDG